MRTPVVCIDLEPTEKTFLVDNCQQIVASVEQALGLQYPGLDGVYNGPPWPDDDSLRVLCAWDWLWDLSHAHPVFVAAFTGIDNPWIPERLPDDALVWYQRADAWIKLWDTIGM